MSVLPKIAALGCLLFGGAVFGQISIDSTAEVYSEDFDSLSDAGFSSWSSNSTLPGWYASAGQISASYRNGTTTLNSFGSFSLPDDRALGGSVSGAGGQDTTRFAVRLINNTGQTLYSADISYYGEKWWASGINNGFHYAGGFVVDYAINATGISGGTYLNAPSLSFDPPFGIVTDSGGNLFYSGSQDAWAVNGNHPDYRSLITGTLSFVNGLANGDELWVRWTLSSFGEANPLSDGLGIDDLTISLSTTPVPEPGSVALLAGGAALAFAARRRRCRE